MAACEDGSVMEKTRIWSVAVTRSLEDEGDQARDEMGPLRSEGSLTAYTFCSVSVDRRLMADEVRVAISLPSGLTTQCGDAAQLGQHGAVCR